MQYCGDGGACEKVSDFEHRCSCRDGYANLLNDTSYPCYRQLSVHEKHNPRAEDTTNISKLFQYVIKPADKNHMTDDTTI
ncbi:hypothetical protein EJB05_30243, partial [Eragrostis curvula]